MELRTPLSPECGAAGPVLDPTSTGDDVPPASTSTTTTTTTTASILSPQPTLPPCVSTTATAATVATKPVHAWIPC